MACDTERDPMAAERVAYTQLDPPIGLCGAHLVDDAARDLPEVGRGGTTGETRRSAGA